MKRINKILLIILLTLVITGCNNKTYLNEISYKEYQKLLENNETFILEIMRTDCSACIGYKPTLKKVTDEYKIEVKYINTDHISKDEVKNLYKEIDGTPTIIFYENGKEKTVASRIVGNVSYEKTIAKFKANGYINEDD